MKQNTHESFHPNTTDTLNTDTLNTKTMNTRPTTPTSRNRLSSCDSSVASCAPHINYRSKEIVNCSDRRLVRKEKWKHP